MPTTFGGGYTPSGRSRLDLSGLAEGIRERNTRMDAAIMPMLQAYGPTGVALLAQQGDDAAARFMDRYYGRDNWQQYVPKVTETEEGTPTIEPPEGVTWDWNQRAAFERDYLGATMEQAPDTREFTGEMEEQPQPRQDRELPEPEPVSRSDEQFIPPPEEEQPPARDEQPPAREEQPEPTETTTPTAEDSAEEPASPATGDRFIEYLQTFQKNDTLGALGVEPTGQMTRAQTFRDRPMTPEEELRYQTRAEAIQLARQGIPLTVMEQALLQNGMDRQTVNTLISEVMPYYQQFLNPQAQQNAVPPQTPAQRQGAGGEAFRRGQEGLGAAQTNQLPPGTQIPQASPVAPQEAPQNLQGSPLMRGYGNQPIQRPDERPTSMRPDGGMGRHVVGSDVSGRVDSMTGQMTGESQPVEIERGVNPTNGAVMEVVRTGNSSVPVRNQTEHITAMHIREAINNPNTPRGEAGQAALRNVSRRAAPELRREVRSAPTMVPVGAFARQVHDFVRSDPAGASMYFKQMADNLIGAESTMASTAYNRALARQATATARRTEMETEAMEALPEAERNRLYRAKARLADAQATILEAQAGIAAETAEAELAKILEDVEMSEAQREMLTKRLSLEWAKLDLQERTLAARIGGGSPEQQALAFMLEIGKAMEDPTKQSELFDFILEGMGVERTEPNIFQSILNFFRAEDIGGYGATGVTTPEAEQGAQEGDDFSTDWDVGG